MDIATDERTTKLDMEGVDMHKGAKTSSGLSKFQEYMLLY